MTDFVHLPVMAREALYYLACRPGGVYVDGTAGGGGHSLEILKATNGAIKLIGIDRDADALKAAAKTLEGYKDRVTLVKENFRNIRKVLEGLGVKEVDGILLDLGVSSYQFDASNRGFSFRLDARLDMRMDQSQGESAYEMVNMQGSAELARIFKLYGQERFAGRIAGAIITAREKRPVETTGELAGIVYQAIPRRFHEEGQHPATRVFQALRIAVNDEMEGLKAGLHEGFNALKSGGRFAVISFHSLEDRIVKENFRHLAADCVCPPRIPQCVCGKKAEARILTPRPVVAADEEIKTNPRARSAKLRAIEKL